MDKTDLTVAQTVALIELNRLSTPASISVIDHATFETDLVVGVTLNTAAFARADGGLPIEAREQLFIVLSEAYPWIPPVVRVAHHRWDGFPHVLQGERLCLYLDPATEWNPLAGMAGFLVRLWDWFDDAIANRFDPATALYQPVGGVFHRTTGAPTVVVGDALGNLADGFGIVDVTLYRRGEQRIDVLGTARNGPLPAGTFRGALVVLSDALPRGGGFYLSDLAVAIRGQDSRNQRRRFLATISKTARTLEGDQHLHVLIAVPNRHLTGQARFHLIGWRLPRQQVTRAIELTGRRHQVDNPRADDEPRVEWTFIDDGRTGVTTRRDHARPVRWFAGKSVELWGCGALGSWIAELLVRAGVKAITLRDTGYVTTGLLVRQNFNELDVGRTKVEALADRLRTISDRVTVTAHHGVAQAGLNGCSSDVIFDCTVNTGVAVAVEQAQTDGRLHVPVVQIATDSDSATLGIVTVTTGEPGRTTNQIDNAVRDAATTDASLRPYMTFWNQEKHPPLTPTIGCSVPTFHGAAADAAAVASSALGLASIALGRGIRGGYLFATAQCPHEVPLLVAVPLEC